MPDYGKVTFRSSENDWTPIYETRCTQPLCGVKKRFGKEKQGTKGRVVNKLTSDGKKVFGWCKQCGMMYEPITKNGQTPKRGNPKPLK